MALNNIEKSDYSPVKISYTNKDYTNILDGLINSVQGITQKWNTTDENDFGIVLIKLMAILGDMLFYNQDMAALEVYPDSVTERKNAEAIFKLIGYKMRWYRSAKAIASVVNTYTNVATIPRFCTFNNAQGTTPYCTFDQYDVVSNTTNNGFEVPIELIQGVPVTPVRISNNPYPEANKPWHSIYGYNYTIDDIVNNRIYLPHQNVDQDHIIVVDDVGDTWTLQENIYYTTAVGKYYQFGVDINDQPYIEIVDYYNNFNISKFKIFYIRSNGSEGRVYSDIINTITGSVWSRTGSSASDTVYNVSNFIRINSQFASTDGYDPETADEARKNSQYYINTLDTLITLADFERATMREEGVANVRATDLTNDPGVSKTCWLGDINEDGLIDEDDYSMLEEFISGDRTLTSFQRRLATLSQTDGTHPNISDLACLRAFLDSHPVEQPDGSWRPSTGDLSKVGLTGAQQLSSIETLDGFTVKLYILRTDEYDSDDETYDESYIQMIKSDLQEYKVLPLDIEVDLHSIKKYYWSLVGYYVTKEPLNRGDLQDITLEINRTLKYYYSSEKVNFNEAVNYREVINRILEVDSRIQYVELEPITYYTPEGESVSKETVTGKYRQHIDVQTNKHYVIQLNNYPILPGSVALKINGGQYILRDNANGDIYNTDNILDHKGSINYTNGLIDIEFVSSDIIYNGIDIDYTKNETNIALYRNLSTTEFTFEPSSLKISEV